MYKRFDVKGNESEIKSFLEDIVKRKEFNNYDPKVPESYAEKVFGYTETLSKLSYPSMYPFFGSQYFIENFINPNTPNQRCLLQWQVGTGKSKAIGAIAHNFIKQYKVRATLGENSPQVFVVSFTQEIIQNELIKDPYFGFATVAEIIEWNTLKIAANKAGPGTEAMQTFSAFMGNLRRRITNKVRGGYYVFYGYKTFSTRLFIPTAEGEKVKFNILEYTDNKVLNSNLMASQNETMSYTDVINEAVKKGYITVNMELINSMKNALLICDEIHNVYNITEANNYGIAIQYVLDTLGDDAPKCVFMSATPVTGAASEIVDLLNLLVPKNDMKKLVPKGYLSRSDLFVKTTSKELDEEQYFTVSALKPGALDLIKQLSIGRISFLLDSNVNAYPKRIIVGEDVKNVPYLKLNLCPMSEYQQAAFKEERGEKGDTDGLNVNAYALNDMVFPNPNGEIGLYNSTELINTYLRANPDWMKANGVIVEKIIPYGNIVTGNFLHIDNLKKYSAKYTYMINLVKKIIKDDCGKILIYHNRVRMSGVLIIAEILKMNGILDENGIPGEDSICNICGNTKKTHHNVKGVNFSTFAVQSDIYLKKPTDHPFVPVRFLLVNSDIDKNTFERRKAMFNTDFNTLGHNFRIFLGSKIIKEGHEFVSTRHEIITSFPINYPITIQVMGRIIRRQAHQYLPETLRQGKIYFLVSTLQNGSVGPELKKYTDKGHEYLVIQEVIRVMAMGAVDNFMNYPKIKLVQETNGYMDILPYTPIMPNVPNKIETTTFNAYRYNDTEIEILQNIIKILFKARAIWAYKDLIDTIKSKVVTNINYDHFDPKNVNIALHLCKSYHNVNGTMMKVVYLGGKDQYYLYTSGNVDIECYLPQRLYNEHVMINLTEYMKSGLVDRNFKLKLVEFESILKSNHPELILTEFTDEFHYILLKKLILGTKTTSDDEKAYNIYKKFKIIVKSKDYYGYVTPNSVIVYNGKEWINMLHSDFGIGKRHKENNIIVGIVTNEENSILNESQFKLRNSNMLNTDITDNRRIVRGLACRSYSRERLEQIFESIKRSIYSHDIKINLDKDEINAAYICKALKIMLLALELNSRKDNMLDSTRYIYLFNE